jgi:hypothetical protein
MQIRKRYRTADELREAASTGQPLLPDQRRCWEHGKPIRTTWAETAAEGLAEGIVRAFNEPARSARLGLRARQLVEREHTYEAFKGKLADVYAYLEGHRRAAPSTLSAE